MTPYDISLTVLSALAVLTMGLGYIYELRRDLMMLQQNSYRQERYIRWLKASKDTTSTFRLFTYILFFASLNGLSSRILPYIAISGIILCGIILWRRLATARYKKPLAMTPRARRLFIAQISISAVIIAFAVVAFGTASTGDAVYCCAVALVGCLCGSHIITMAALQILRPVESHINRKFYNSAADRLRSMPNLKIVGITGSYGKTSTKHFLHRILSEHFDTLMTPGSFNTTLGVVRTVNEYLKPYNEVFIVEMGAKQPGDIREICDLVHPSVGIITAVGPQHLETFGNIENVRDTKFELVDSLPADGLAVVNNDFPMSAGREVTNTGCLRYGITNKENCSYTADHIVYGPDGTSFTVHGDGRSLELTTALLGECNISDLLAAIAVATALGVPDEKIRYAVSSIQPVEHRLSRRRLPSGLTIIDDAFNSNPSGSKMALDVLAMMKHGHRFVITPGMIELGNRQYELNKELGRHAAASADTAIVVGDYNRDAIVSGLEEGGMDKARILTFPTFNEAFAFVMAHHGNGDTVLIENDLPDTFK